MRRREFIAGVGAAAAWPYSLRAQLAGQPVIGFMSARSPEDSRNLLQAFHKGLKEEANFVEGDNITIEYRWARGDYTLLPAIAANLAEHRVNVLVALGGDASARAASSSPAPNTIHPVALPPGRLMLCTNPAKRLDFMNEIVPRPSVFGVLVIRNFRPPQSRPAPSKQRQQKLAESFSSQKPLMTPNWRLP